MRMEDAREEEDKEVEFDEKDFQSKPHAYQSKRNFDTDMATWESKPEELNQSSDAEVKGRKNIDSPVQTRSKSPL